MNIVIAHQAPMRRWQRKLADALRDQGHEVALVGDTRRRLGIVVTAALSFEQRIFGPRRSMFDIVGSNSRCTVSLWAFGAAHHRSRRYRRRSSFFARAAIRWRHRRCRAARDGDTRAHAACRGEDDGGSHYPYATGKAVIAVTEIAADGSASPICVVLEQPWHLSYPFLIRHRDEIYMSPEMSRARRVQLFRAAPFPDRWVPDRVLIDDIIAADATFIEHGGRWWMFTTVADDGGSCWDQLCLFHAPDLLGPWEPHAANPVLVDAGAARPAGAMWHADDGALMRVAQDCRTGYGVGLAICRVDCLDEYVYMQTVVTRLAPPEGYGADGVHTLDRVGNLEVIDLHFPSASR